MSKLDDAYEKAMAAAKAIEDAERGKADVEARGTCQACLRQFVAKPYTKMKEISLFTGEKMNYKTGTLVMVKHGFERPGHGYLVGECWGVGHPPFELDVEITKHWRQYLVTHLLPKTRQVLADLKSGKTKIFKFRVMIPLRPDQPNWSKRDYKEIFLTEGEPIPAAWTNDYPPDFKRARSAKIKETENEIEEIEADIKHLGKAIDSWVYSPQKLRSKDKPLTEGQSIRQWLESSSDELRKLQAPAGGPGANRESFYTWAHSFPHTMAWTSMRTRGRNPSYYKYVRSTYEKLTGAAPLEFERAALSGIVSREQEEKQAARKAKLDAREAAKKEKAARSSQREEKAAGDVEMMRKTIYNGLTDEKLAAHMKSHKHFSPYSDTQISQYDFLIDTLTRSKLIDFIMGREDVHGLIERSKKDRWSRTNFAGVRTDLKFPYDYIREQGREAGVKISKT